MDTPLTGAALQERAASALAVPLAQALGLTLIDDDAPAAGASLPPGSAAQGGLADNGFGGVHAAALQALVELAGYLALAPSLTIAEHAVTHAVSTSLIGAAGVHQRLEARGTLDRRTRRLGFVSVTVTADGVTVARSQLVKSVVTMPGA